MKILYGARMGRYDLIRPVQALASLITKWDGLCDEKFHRAVCYINSTLDLNLYGWIGDPPDLICWSWSYIAMQIWLVTTPIRKAPPVCLCVFLGHAALCR